MKNHVKTLDFRGHNGRVFFSTDLHAHFYLLEEKYKEVDFDFSKDILILGGDNLDRGFQNNVILDYIDQPFVHSIRGNHEELFIKTLEDKFIGPAARCLYENGGEWVFKLFDEGHFKFLKTIYDHLVTLPLGIELITDKEKIAIVHSQVPKNDWNYFKTISKRDMNDFGYNQLQWSIENYRDKSDVIVKGVDRVLVGHQPTQSLEVEIYGNTYYCDLGSFYSKKISFIQLV